MLDLVVVISGLAMVVLGCGWIADRKPWIGIGCFLYAALVFALETLFIAFRW